MTMEPRILRSTLAFAGRAAVGLSALLVLASAGVWALSYTVRWGGDAYQGRYALGEYALGCRRGALYIRLDPYPRAFPPSTLVNGRSAPTVEPVPVMASSTFYGYTVRHGPPGGVYWLDNQYDVAMTSGPAFTQLMSREIYVSCWLACAVFCLAPLAWLIRRRLRRYPRGFCPGCGYDLRASAGRCPECGKPVPAPAGG